MNYLFLGREFVNNFTVVVSLVSARINALLTGCVLARWACMNLSCGHFRRYAFVL